MIAFLLFLGTQPPTSPWEGLEIVSQHVAAERVTACGAGPVTFRHDRQSDADILTARETASATREQLLCIDRAAGLGYDVELSPVVQQQFDAIRQARTSAIVAASARQWLSAHKLLDRLPKYQPGVTSDAAFTRDIESLCGSRAKGAFQSEYGFHAISPDWVMRQSQKVEPDGVFACLLNAVSATGYEYEFIGNEALGR
jgi:hypothetical protein